MKKRILLFCLFQLLFVQIGLAYQASTQCRLIGYTDCLNDHDCNTLSLFSPKGDQYIQTASLKANSNLKFWFIGNGEPNQLYTVSPNGQYIEVAEIPIGVPTIDPSEGVEHLIWMFIFDVNTEFKDVYGLPDALAASGSIWSNSSSEFVTIDAYGHYMPALIDVTGTLSFQMWPPAPPLQNIRALSIGWSPDDKHIAVFGEEYPFPVTQNAINDVQTIYVTSIVPNGIADYKPISDPSSDASGDFVWLDNDLLAFTTYHYDRQQNTASDQHLNLVTAEGKQIASFKGTYLIYGKKSDHELLVVNESDASKYEIQIIDSKTLQPKTLLDVPTNGTTYPSLNFSSDFQYVAYLDANGEQETIHNLDDGTERQFVTPIKNNFGWWTPDNKNLLFFDYDLNRIDIYDLATQALHSEAASEFFPNQDKLPLYPNWIC